MEAQSTGALLPIVQCVAAELSAPFTVCADSTVSHHCALCEVLVLAMSQNNLSLKLVSMSFNRLPLVGRCDS